MEDPKASAQPPDNPPQPSPGVEPLHIPAAPAPQQQNTHPPEAPAVPPPPQAHGNWSNEIYPAPMAGVGTPPQSDSPPQIGQPQPSKITKNPFTNIYRGFVKFVKTNFLLAIVYMIAIILLSFLGIYLVSKFTNANSGDLGSFVITLILMMAFVAFIYVPITSLIWSKLTLEGARGHKLGFKDSLRSLKKFWILALYSIVAVAVFGAFVAAMVRLGFSSGSILFPIIMIGVLAVIAVLMALRWCFTVFAIVDYPDSGPINSLKRSSALAKGNQLAILFYWIVVIVIYVIFTVATGQASSSANNSAGYYTYNSNGSYTYNEPSSGSSTKDTVSGVLETVLSLAFYAGLAELYRQIKDSQNPPAPAAQPAMPPPPLAPDISQ